MDFTIHGDMLLSQERHHQGSGQTDQLLSPLQVQELGHGCQMHNSSNRQSLLCSSHWVVEHVSYLHNDLSLYVPNPASFPFTDVRSAVKSKDFLPYPSNNLPFIFNGY